MVNVSGCAMLSSYLTFQNPTHTHTHSLSFSSTSLFPKPPFIHNIIIINNNNYYKPYSLKCQHTTNFTSQLPRAPRVFVGHSIYKGKAALTVEPRSPEFSPLDSGAFKLAREGYVLLQFAPAAAVRQYDWTRKQVFSLSVTEIGTLMSLGARDSCEFFHDPNKGKSDEGKVRKVLKVVPLPDGSGHSFSLSVQNKLINMEENVYIPITKAEYTVLISAFNYIVPYLLGWHSFANSIKPDDSSRSNNANPRSGVDYEWSR